MLVYTPWLVVLKIHVWVFSELVWTLFCPSDLLTSNFLVWSSISWIYLRLMWPLCQICNKECNGCGNPTKDFNGKDWCKKPTEPLCYSFIIPVCPFYTFVIQQFDYFPSCLPVVDVFKELFTSTMIFVCRHFLDCLLVLLISCLHLTCHVLWASLSFLKQSIF